MEQLCSDRGAEFCFGKKLKLLKEDLRKWNVEEFGHLKYQKANVVDVIRCWDLE